ncbi:hypothetical protein E2320_003700 [Naja naja]|nr:hypothetical protein E2320_003700 [Naja naja]
MARLPPPAPLGAPWSSYLFSHSHAGTGRRFDSTEWLPRSLARIRRSPPAVPRGGAGPDPVAEPGRSYGWPPECPTNLHPLPLALPLPRIPAPREPWARMARTPGSATAQVAERKWVPPSTDP